MPYIHPDQSAATIAALMRAADDYSLGDFDDRAAICRQLAQDLAAELAAETEARAAAWRAVDKEGI